MFDDWRAMLLIHSGRSVGLKHRKMGQAQCGIFVGSFEVREMGEWIASSNKLPFGTGIWQSEIQYLDLMFLLEPPFIAIFPMSSPWFSIDFTMIFHVFFIAVFEGHQSSGFRVFSRQDDPEVSQKVGQKSWMFSSHRRTRWEYKII